MLVLTRRAGESIVIGDEVRVVVLEVRGDTVRLGIEAPRSVQVHRAEVYAEVQAANAAAVSRVDNLESVANRLQRLARPRQQAGRDAQPQPRAPQSSPAQGSPAQGSPAQGSPAQGSPAQGDEQPAGPAS